MSTVVVGVDGSSESIAALRYGLREARLHRHSLTVVAAWHVPALAYGGGFVPAPTVAEDYRSAAEIALEEALAEVRDETDDVPILKVVREGEAADILVQESEGAAQLIVGCHQLGHLRSLFHHSVSGDCTHDARCPVTVVHAD